MRSNLKGQKYEYTRLKINLLAVLLFTISNGRAMEEGANPNPNKDISLNQQLDQPKVSKEEKLLPQTNQQEEITGLEGKKEATETSIEKTNNNDQMDLSPLMILPKDILKEIISFLPEAQAESALENYFSTLDYFNTLNNLRLTSKESRNMIDDFVEKFLEKYEIAPKPNQSKYQAFKSYIASEINKLIDTQAQKEEREIKKAQEQIRDREINRRRPQRFTIDDSTFSIRIAITDNYENWLLKNRKRVLEYYKVNPSQIIFKLQKRTELFFGNIVHTPLRRLLRMVQKECV